MTSKEIHCEQTELQQKGPEHFQMKLPLCIIHRLPTQPVGHDVFDSWKVLCSDGTNPCLSPDEEGLSEVLKGLGPRSTLMIEMSLAADVFHVNREILILDHICKSILGQIYGVELQDIDAPFGLPLRPSVLSSCPKTAPHLRRLAFV